MLDDDLKLLRIDCSIEHEICDIFKNHVDTKFPQLVYVNKERFYSYTDNEGNHLSINAQEVMNTFFNNQGFKKFPIHGGSGTTTRELIKRGHEYVMDIIERNKPYQPGFIE